MQVFNPSNQMDWLSIQDDFLDPPSLSPPDRESDVSLKDRGARKGNNDQNGRPTRDSPNHAGHAHRRDFSHGTTSVNPVPKQPNAAFDLDFVDETSSRDWYVREFYNVLMSPDLHYRDKIKEMLLEHDADSHYGLSIEVMKLLESHVSLASVLLIHAEKLLLLFDEALFRAQQHILRDSELDMQPKMSLKPLCHVRLTALPSCPSVYRPKISSIRNQDVGRFVAVVGTVIRTGISKVLESQREYKCAKCSYQFNVFSAADQRNVFVLPSICPSRHANIGSKCRSRAFQYVEGSKICRDYQEIKIQESSHRLAMGAMPRSLIVLLVDDLIDTCQAGDDVVVAGVVGHLWSSFSREQRCDLDLVLHANHVQVTNDTRASVTVTDEHRAAFARFWKRHQKTPVIGRSILLNSICPQLCGVWIPRLAVLLTLIGGVAVVDPSSGTRTRGQSHLLIIGDPGTGKSKLLQFASQILTRSVSTTGTGTTNAGLTVAAVPDPATGEWGLEAGALVLADGGICCIDEFGCMRESDKSVVHEAMEQQTISVAKAGLVCTLHTRASVFAIQNPKPVAYDLGMAGAATAEDLSLVTGIASPLLSRFDLILLLWDPKTDEWDGIVTKHILNSLPEPDAETIISSFNVTLDDVTMDDRIHFPGETDTASNKHLITNRRKKGGAIIGGTNVFLETELLTTQSQTTTEHELTPSTVLDKEMDETERLTRLAMREVARRTVPSLPHWQFEKLQTYIHYVRGVLEPHLTSRSNKVLMAYYNYQRASSDRTPALTSVRLLESLVRLAQAHARLMLHDHVTLSDAVHVVLLMDAAMTDLKDGPAPPSPQAAATRKQWDPTYGVTHFRERYWLKKQLSRLGFTMIDQYRELALGIVMRDFEKSKVARSRVERQVAKRNNGPNPMSFSSRSPQNKEEVDEDTLIEQAFLENAWPSDYGTDSSSIESVKSVTGSNNPMNRMATNPLTKDFLVPTVPFEDLPLTPDESFLQAELAVLKLFNLQYLRGEEPFEFDYDALFERLNLPSFSQLADRSVRSGKDDEIDVETLSSLDNSKMHTAKVNRNLNKKMTKDKSSSIVEWLSKSQDDAVDAVIEQALRDSGMEVSHESQRSESSFPTTPTEVNDVIDVRGNNHSITPLPRRLNSHIAHTSQIGVGVVSDDDDDNSDCLNKRNFSSNLANSLVTPSSLRMAKLPSLTDDLDLKGTSIGEDEDEEEELFQAAFAQLRRKPQQHLASQKRKGESFLNQHTSSASTKIATSPIRLSPGSPSSTINSKIDSVSYASIPASASSVATNGLVLQSSSQISASSKSKSNDDVRETHLRRALALYEPAAAYAAPSALDRARSKLYSNHSNHSYKTSIVLPTAPSSGAEIAGRDVNTQNSNFANHDSIRAFFDEPGRTTNDIQLSSILLDNDCNNHANNVNNLEQAEKVRNRTDVMNLCEEDYEEEERHGGLVELGKVRARTNSKSSSSSSFSSSHRLRRPSKRIAIESDVEDNVDDDEEEEEEVEASRAVDVDDVGYDNVSDSD